MRSLPTIGEMKKALADRKSDNNNTKKKNNNKNKNNVRGHWGPVSGSKILAVL